MAAEIQQIRLGKMALFAYLVGDPQSGSAALVDPAFETDRLMALAVKAGYRVTHIVNTHGHPDHVAGNAAVKKATGARLLIHEADAGSLAKMGNRLFARVLGGSGSPPADRLLTDGDTISIGETAIRVVHTPGHTPGGICLQLPGHLITGDTLFVGAVGRTDLPGGNARQLIQSIRSRIQTLPPETVIWPGHDYGDAPRSTVSREAATNPYLTPADFP